MICKQIFAILIKHDAKMCLKFAQQMTFSSLSEKKTRIIWKFRSGKRGSSQVKMRLL